MVFLEVLLSYSKLLMTITVIGIALFYLLFRSMSGGMFYYYSRSTALIGMEQGLLHAKRFSGKFEPIFKNTRTLPMNNTLFIEGVLIGNKKFKRMESGEIRHEIFLE